MKSKSKKINRKNKVLRKKPVSITPKFKVAEIKDIQLDKFLENETKYLVEHPNESYTFDDFIVKFNRHKNLYSPNYQESFSELKSTYYTLVETIFKEGEIIYIIDNPEINYDKAVFDMRWNDYKAKNDITNNFFNKTSRDEANLYNNIIEDASKYTFGKKTLNEKSSLTRGKSNYTKFNTRFQALKDSYLVYRRDTNKTEPKWTTIKRKVEEFLNKPFNRFDNAILQSLGQEADYNQKVSQISEALKYLESDGVPVKKIKVKAVQEKLMTPTKRKEVKKKEVKIADIEEVEVLEEIADEVINEITDEDKQKILSLESKIRNSKGATKKHIPKWEKEIKMIQDKYIKKVIDNPEATSTPFPIKKEDVFETSEIELNPGKFSLPPKMMSIDLDESATQDEIEQLKQINRKLGDAIAQVEQNIAYYNSQIEAITNKSTDNDADQSLFESQLQKFNDKVNENKRLLIGYEDDIRENDKTIEQLRNRRLGKGLSIDNMINDIIENELRKMKGKGLFNDLYKKAKNIFTNSYSPATDKAIKMYKDNMITNVIIYRTPVSVKSVLNFLSLGQFKDNYKMHYDDIYHLYAVFEMMQPNGQKVYTLTEKTPNIVFESRKDLGSSAKDAQFVIYTPPKPVNFLTMIQGAMHMLGNNFHKYSADKYNCQNYILALIDSLALFAGSSTPMNIKDFIYQDPEILFNNLNGVRKVSNTITGDIAHTLNRIIGKGKPRRKTIRFGKKLSVFSPAMLGGDLNQDVVNVGTEAIGAIQQGLYQLPEVGKVLKFVGDNAENIVNTALNIKPKTLNSIQQKEKGIDIFNDSQYITNNKYPEDDPRRYEFDWTYPYKDETVHITKDDQTRYMTLQNFYRVLGFNQSKWMNKLPPDQRAYLFPSIDTHEGKAIDALTRIHGH